MLGEVSLDSGHKPTRCLCTAESPCDSLSCKNRECDIECDGKCPTGDKCQNKVRDFPRSPFCACYMFMWLHDYIRRGSNSSGLSIW